MEPLDPQTCYRRLQSRDARFDGRFFVAVSSTGIYCRPICPARTPKPENCRFYPSAPAAQEAGYRPCLRCRPESAPALGAWRGTSNTVSRGLGLIAQGALDGEGVDVETLAARLGVGGRQLRRLFRQHLGASPLAVAQTRRVLFAKQLLRETRLPMTEVALAAGFGSVRRFNETFQQLYNRPPRELRRTRQEDLAEGSSAAGGVTLRLAYRPPYDWPALLGFLRGRAITGMELAGENDYRRTFLEDGQPGDLWVRPTPDHPSLSVTIRCGSVRHLPAIVARVRRVFDLDADGATIAGHLAHDPMLADLLARRPGLRVPGGWDGFELAMRAILGQQITVTGARKLGEALVVLAGTVAQTGQPDLGRCFPTPAQVMAAELEGLKMPGSRRATLRAMAGAALADPALFEPAETLEASLARLRAIPGIGDWTAQYIALRGMRDPDAFPAGDIGLQRALTGPDGVRPTPAQLMARAEGWRPWRAYAAQHLWMADPAMPGAGAGETA